MPSPFYSAYLKAWRAVRGSGSVSGLVVASSSASPLSVDMVSCKICYQLLLSFNPCVPHCVTKFQASYQIDWPSTWRSLFFLPLDRQVIDFSWKVAHRVPYTADHLISFGYGPFSDHSAVVFISSIPNAIPCGPGRWHLNISILDDPDFITLISDFWTRWQRRKLSFPSISVWWDLGKCKVKGLSINYCKEKSRERHSSRSVLINLVSHLKLRIDSGVVSCIEVYHNVLAQISTLDSIAAKGSQVRSRVRWAEEGETSSSFFFRLEKKRGSESWISAIRIRDDVVVSKIDEICSVWRSFYLGFFSAVETDAVTATGLLDNLDSFLTPEQAASCDGPLTVAKVLTALNGMSRNKTPGSDGLPVEFYIKFWHVIGSDLTEVFNNAYDSDSLSKSQKLGLITLLFKKGDRLNCKNWRPHCSTLITNCVLGLLLVAS